MTINKKTTESAKLFNLLFTGERSVVAYDGNRRYTFIACCKGLLNEVLFTVCDDKNKYRVLEYSKIKTKQIEIL